MTASQGLELESRVLGWSCWNENDLDKTGLDYSYLWVWPIIMRYWNSSAQPRLLPNVAELHNNNLTYFVIQLTTPNIVLVISDQRYTTYSMKILYFEFPWYCHKSHFSTAFQNVLWSTRRVWQLLYRTSRKTFNRVICIQWSIVFEWCCREWKVWGLASAK